MPDVMGVYERLRVDEYLQFHAAAYGVPRNQWPELIEGLLELVDLDVKRDAMVDSLSRGMKQRLSLPGHGPRPRSADPRRAGLGARPPGPHRVPLLLAELQRLGKTILISSHILAELQQMCTDIAVIEAGKLLAAGTPSEILNRLRVVPSGHRAVPRRSEAEYPVADEAEQAALLKRLMAEDGDGREVMEFKVVTHDLEDLFLQITEGIVQ